MNRTAITGSFYGLWAAAKLAGRRLVEAPSSSESALIDRHWNVTAFPSHQARTNDFRSARLMAVIVALRRQRAPTTADTDIT